MNDLKSKSLDELRKLRDRFDYLFKSYMRKANAFKKKSVEVGREIFERVMNGKP